MPTVLFSLAVALQVAITAVLIHKYLVTRDTGFLWLGFAVVVWPLVSRFATPALIDQLLSKQFIGPGGQMTLGSFVYLLGLLEQLIGVGLLMVAVLYLCKTRSDPNRQATV